MNELAMKNLYNYLLRKFGPVKASFMSRSLFKTFGNPVSKLLALLALISLSEVAGAQGTETIKTGSFIINMGNLVTTTANDDLLPYGLIYDLLRNHKVPVMCAIHPTKDRDGIDFTHNGVQFKGGTYIIPANYRTAEVNAKIAAWQAKGVVGANSVSDFTTYIAYTIDYYPLWTLDRENGKIARHYLQSAGLTIANFPTFFPAGDAEKVDNMIYDWILPENLDCCHDLFVIPHADPTWAVHNRLLSWNLDCKGAIWAGCNAVSHLENITNPANREIQMNFLVTKNADRNIVDDPYVQNSLILDKNHADPTTPFTWLQATDPVAQFIGAPGKVYQQGAEQVYIPIQTASKPTLWREGVKVLGYDPTHSNVTTYRADLRNAPALAVYGRGFDDPERGYVMYQAGHEYKVSADVNTSEYAAAVRPFLNFSYFQMGLKAPEVDSILGISHDQNLKIGEPVWLTADATSPLAGAQLTYKWEASCGGTFSNDTGRTTSFTPAPSGRNELCIISVTVTDECGRQGFSSSPVWITPATLAVSDFNATVVNMAVSGSVMTNDFDPDGDSLLFAGFETPGNPGNYATGTISNVPGIDLMGNPVANAGTFVVNEYGIYTFTPSQNFTGKVQIDYQVSDNGPFESEYVASLTLHVVQVPDPTSRASNGVYANDDAEVTYATSLTSNVLLNDGDPESEIFQLSKFTYDNNGDGTRESVANPGNTITVGGYNRSGAYISSAGQLSMQTNGAYTFTPTSGFSGQIVVMYHAEDVVSHAFKSYDSALLIIEVWPSSNPENDAPFAGDDFSVTQRNREVTGNWAVNDKEKDGHTVKINQSTAVNLGSLSGTSVLSTRTTAAGGNIRFLSNGTYIYTPPTDYVGPDRVTYQLCDVTTVLPNPLCDSATVYFLVHAQVRDYGDLLTSVWSPAWNLYLDQNNDNVPDGANAVWLGAKVSSELTSYSSSQANLDTYDDGVIIPSLLDTVNGSNLVLTLNGVRSELPVYYKVFIDWNLDGTFDSSYAGGVVLTGSPAQVNVKYLVPKNEDGVYCVRVRVSDDPNALLAFGEIRNGETEDYYTIGVPVPVTWLFLRAVPKSENSALLQWATATEENNSHFLIMRSSKSSDFEVIASVDGNGNSTSVKFYEWLDDQLMSGHTYYYKIRQVNFDGEYSESEIVSVRMNNEEKEPVVFPNPVADRMYIASGTSAVRSVVVTNLSGAQVYQATLPADQSAFFEISTAQWSHGLYFVRLEYNGSSTVIRVLK